MTKTIKKLLIANRGEIACRVIRTTRRMGIATVAVYSEADATALHVREADEAWPIGPAPAAESYLDATALLEAARLSGADAIHPGYGFLSENPDFVDAVEGAGLIFVGPPASAIRAMGLKDAAKDLMAGAGVPVVPGYQGESQEPDFLAEEAARIGYPVLIKARAGGGGKGMRKVDAPEDFAAALASARREGQASFGDPHVLIEKFITSPRHVEVQVFGDSHGNHVHLFERDCSLQRRHQKVIEEAPAPGIDAATRAAMTEAAVTAARTIGYRGAGTIEFIADGSGPLRPDGFWFMEMNTRLQVEHPVTEAVTGLDLVEWQLRVAAGEPLPLQQDQITLSGHAFEARLYAEDPETGFLPSTGQLARLRFSDLARNDTGVAEGDSVTPWYDPMIAKVITRGADRAEALAALVAALKETDVAGLTANTGFLARLAQHPGFVAESFDTGLIDRDLEALTAPAAATPAHLAAAAIAALDLRPDTPRLGWRQWGVASHRLTLSHRGEDIVLRLEVAEDRLILTGEEISLELQDWTVTDNTIQARIATGRRRLDAHVAALPQPGGTLYSVQIDTERQEFLLADPLQGGAGQGASGNLVMAPMTGLIVAVSASPGDRVQAGDALGVIEAMKMETALLAPCDGVVSELHCAAGDQVEGGALLISLAEEETA